MLLCGRAPSVMLVVLINPFDEFDFIRNYITHQKSSGVERDAEERCREAVRVPTRAMVEYILDRPRRLIQGWPKLGFN